MIKTILFLLGNTSMFFKTHSISFNHCGSEWLVVNENADFITEETQLNNGELFLGQITLVVRYLC